MVTVADTAYSIATIRANEAARPPHERLFDDPYAAVFAAAGAHAAEATQRFLDLPFFVDGIRLRTRFIDDATRAGLAAGLTQLVLMGAGFDARALRLPEARAPGVQVFEVDFNEQLERKREILAASAVPWPPNVACVACDFRADDLEAALSGALSRAGFRAGAGAMFVWEGVLGYIDQATTERMLALMARVGGKGSRVVFDHGHGRFDPEGPEAVLRRLGYSAFEEHGCDALWRRWQQGDAHENAWFVKLGLAVV